MRTVHPSVQLEEQRQAIEPAINESASVFTSTVAAALSRASSSTSPQLPKPSTQSILISNHFQLWMTKDSEDLPIN